MPTRDRFAVAASSTTGPREETMVQAAAQRRRLGAARRGGPETGATEDGRAASSAAKTCAILRAFAARSPLRLTDIAAATGLNKVTALRIVETLIEEGFVAREAQGRGFARGREILALAATAGRPDDIRALARPSLVRLAALSGDTVILSVRSGPDSVCLDREVGSFPIRANYLEIGSRRPLGVGAGALALLSALPDREIEAVLDASGARLAPYPRLDAATLRDLVAESRARGHVLLLDRVVDRMGAIGIPVLDDAGTVAAALSIAALTERIVERADALAAALRREADLVRRELAGAADAGAGP